MNLVLVVPELEMVIVKPVVHQEQKLIFYTQPQENVLYKSVVTVKISLHQLQVNYFVMLDLVQLE